MRVFLPLYRRLPWRLAAAAAVVVLAPLVDLPTAMAQPAPKGTPATPAAPKGGAPVPAGSSSAKPAGSAAPPGSAAPAAPAPGGSAAPVGSAAPAGSASATGLPTLPPAPGAPPPADTSAPTATQAPPPPDPSADQVAALAAMQKEAEAYETSAKDYRSTITRIVQHHYEERRRKVLSALDKELDIERKGLVDAREEAIRRLEAFIARYSGANAHPENTPDAMFRLAALYEEKVRADADDPGDRLEPAIALYKRIIKEFPKYRELPGVYYYLGHALNDSNRFAEAQQIWRSLVCHNEYPYPVEVDPKDPTRDTVTPLPQDHDADYWRGWESRHPEPFGKNAKTFNGKGNGAKTPKAPPPKPAAKPAGAQPAGAKPPKKGKPSDLSDETEFQNPYPDTCVAMPQKTLEGQDPRYIGEVWWLIGDYHFNEVDQTGGPFNLNRAQSAYTQSLKFKKPPVYGVAMYKLAWTYFKQQRYHQSVTQFVELLRFADEQEKLTGDPGSDFRAEAYTYIAGSLTYLDFEGPDGSEPYIPRNDVLDVETDPKKAEQKMRIAIDRVQDPTLIPQDQKWTVDIYKALAQEFRELNQYKNTIEMSELILTKWPMDRDAPVVQNTIAEIYDTLMRQSREGTPEYAEYSQKALEARTKLAKYVGNTPWVDKNKDDPEAIETAERLVKGGLRRAAADHTNQGRALAEQGLGIEDKASRDPVFERALKEYQLAAQGWDGYLAQDQNSSDAYESRYWLADANHMTVVLTVALDRSPTEQQVEVARKTAIAVRDSNEDNKFLQPSAVFVVDIAHQQLLDQYKQWKASSGSSGIEERDGVKMSGSGKDAKVMKDPVPPMVLAAIKARDEYIQRVPRDADPKHNQDAYAFDAANYFFVYGQFDEARKRFQPIYDKECGKSEYGFKAWDRLQSMADLENNVDESRRLAEAALTRPCGTNAAEVALEKKSAELNVSRGYYVDAARAYEKAEKMAPGPERDKAWRDAAALYKVALQKAPGRDEAPEAAIYGAKAFKQVGEYDEAISMYELFIKEYGNEENLAKLEKGDPSATPPKAADPDQYKKRVENLKVAYDALSAAYVLFFNYRSAAEKYDTISKNKRFTETDRKEAARNAVLLYANIGDDDKMLAARQTLYGLNPSAKAKAEIDFLVAGADYKRWDEHGAESGPNAQARLKATTSMDAYFSKNKGTKEAAPFVVEAAYSSAKMRKAGNDLSGAKSWCGNTIKAFDTYKTTAVGPDGKNTALGSRYADMAAECAFADVDAEIKQKFDYDTNHHRYTGVIDKVKVQFDKDVDEANKTWFPKLDAVITSYASKQWSVAARARQGSLYDSCRTGLYNAAPPGLKLYSEKEERLLKLAETSDREDLQEQADALRQKRREDWRTAREKSLATADKAMVKFYAEAVVWAKAYKVRNEYVDMAIRKLAFYTDILGNDKLRDYSQGVLDPDTKSPFVYTDNFFLRSRPGISAPLTPNGLPTPLPVTP